MCFLQTGNSVPAPTPVPAPPPAAPEKKSSQLAPVTNAQAQRKANPNAATGVSAFRNDLLLPGATTGLNL